MRYTKKDLKKMLKENGISKTSNNKMALMMLAIESNLIDKNEWMEDVKEEQPVGRPRKQIYIICDKNKNVNLSVFPVFSRM